MARLVILQPPKCDYPRCTRKATRRLEDEEGLLLGTFCTGHGSRELTASEKVTAPAKVQAAG